MSPEVGDQVKGYLKDTREDGLMFVGDSGENDLLEVFTDASFGDQSYGCVMVLIHGSPVLWKCGKQGTSSLSTAESELQEIIDGMTAGESTYAVGREIFGEMKRVLWTDSQPAMSIMSSEGGSWRTRHLRLKSAHARARLQTGEWSIRHLPGERMISDIGTKPLTSTRILALKREMGMWVEAEQIKDERAEEDQKLLGEGAGDAFPCEVDGERTVLEDLSAHERGIRAERVLRLLAIAAVLQVGRGEDPVEPSGEGRDVFSFEMFLVFYTLVVIMISIVATWAWLRKSGRGSSSASSSDPVAIEESVPERLDEVEKDAPDALGEESMVEKADGGSGHRTVRSRGRRHSRATP